MAVEEVIDIPVSLISRLGEIALWLQAVGIIVVIWIIFLIVNFVINRKRMKELYTIKEDMRRMEKKLDMLIKKK